MNNPYRRFEILLPLKFNDGTSVQWEMIADTLLELENQFGAISAETQIIQGRWHHQGVPYRDDLLRIFIDVGDTPDHRQFFLEFKAKLKDRFKQLEIWMTTYSIEVL